MSEPTVVQIITQLELGGAQEMALIFCRHLVQRGYPVHLITGPGGILDRDADSIPSLRVHYEPDLLREVNPWRDARALASLQRRLRGLRRERGTPIVVHTHSSKAGILGRWAAYLAGAEVRVHSIHGFGFHAGQRPIVRRAFELTEQLTAPITSGFCPVSEANRRVAERLGLLRGGKPTLVLPAGIAQQDYEPRPGEGPDLRRELGLEADTPLVGMIACLKPQKAPLDFVRVAERVQRSHPKAHFYVAGDGELRPEMDAEIVRLGLRGRVHLLGWRRDVRSLLGAADLLVLTSLWEGLPRVVLQAMAAARPMVATRVDGTPEAVSDGVTGFLLEPHDIAGLSDRVSRLLADPPLARSMGEQARAALKPFRVEKILARLESFYRELLGIAAPAS